MACCGDAATILKQGPVQDVDWSPLFGTADSDPVHLDNPEVLFKRFRTEHTDGLPKELADSRREVLIGLEFHLGASHGKSQDTLMGQFGCIGDRSLDPLSRERGVVPQDLFRREPCCQVIQHHRDHDARPRDARFSVTHCGVY